MRWLLNAAYCLALGAILPWWLYKMPQARRYRAGLRQRFGLAPRLPRGPRRLWVHTVSVGEAAIPRNLAARFRQRHPDWQLVFSTATDTGADRLAELYPDCTSFYWPLDLSPCVEAAVERVQPDAVVLVELELWPNFQLACLERRIPVCIVNGRINPGSARLLRVLGRLQPAVWQAVRLCCARSAGDAERFARAGLTRERIVTTGSLKYDTLAVEPDAGRLERLRRLFAIAPDAPVVVAGSTHAGEEEVLYGICERLRAQRPRLRLVLVPRHIERAAAVARRLAALGARVARKTDLDAGRQAVAPDAVIVVDTIGDLGTCWALGSCAFVGRSLRRPGGGQNMMEPAALGRAVIVGPHTGNFRPEMQLLAARAAVVVAEDETALERELRRLLDDPQEAARLGRRARETVLESRGATEATLAGLESALAAAGLLEADARGR